MAFPPGFLDELIARSDIVEIVGSYVALTKKGSNLFGLCPFHSEKTPSFSVSPDKQIYYCFGCKKGGSVINFIMEEEGLNYPEAVRFLADRAGLEVPESQDSREFARKRQRLLDLNRDAARFYHELLRQPEGQAVRDYLMQRRIQKRTAIRFGMGASPPDQWDRLLLAMTQKGYSKQELRDTGLIVENKRGGFYDKFRNRLMLPVIDIQGNVVAFGSRSLDGSVPKYMNSPETPVYSKRRVLYGLNLAKKSKRPNLILCEGNLDVTTLHQAGFDNAVASMGTALTQEQIRLLSRFTKELVLCYDNDQAGKIATDRALELLKDSEFQVKVLQLPQRMKDGALIKQDPDDFIKFQGPDAFQRLLNGSENGSDFQLSQIAAKYNLRNDPSRIAYSGEVAEWLSGLNNPVEQEIYTVRAAEIAEISVEALKLEVQRMAKRRNRQKQRNFERKNLNPAVQIQPKEKSLQYANIRSARAEEGIFRLLLLEPDLFSDQIFQTFDFAWFSSPLLGKACQILWEAVQSGQNLSLPLLSDQFQPEEMGHLSAVLQQPESRKNAKRALSDYIRIVREEAAKRTGADTSQDPLLAATEKYKHQMGTGGKRNG